MTTSLDDEDVTRILKLVDEMPFDEIELEWKGLRLRVSKRGELSPAQSTAASIVPAATAAPPAAPVAAAVPAPGVPAVHPASLDLAALAPGVTVVKAPVMGTFYRSPEPGKPPFVEVGQPVDDETTLCLLEVMKVYTAVRSDTAGTVERILASDGQFVEFGQPLFLVRA